MKKYRIPVLILLLLFLAAIVSVPLVQQGARQENARLNARLNSWCIGTGRTHESCTSFTYTYRDDERALICHRFSSDLNAPFRDCLTAEGIAPR